MPEYFKTAILCSLLLFFAIPASAEFYQYVDSKGITHFTDNAATIPARYQSQVNRHQEIITLPEELPYPEFAEPRPSAIKSKTPKIEELRAEKNILLDKKKALDQKFEMLMTEKQQIENSRAETEDEKSILIYNQRVKEINTKIKQYKEEETRFKEEIEKFNESISPLAAE